jgi:hypothetical protein
MSVSVSFARLIRQIQPADTEVKKSLLHAAQIRTRLAKSYNLKKFLLAGSFHRRTYVHGSSDVDLFALFARDDLRWGARYVLSTTALHNLGQELAARYPFSTVYSDVHAIVVAFSDRVSVDVVPASFHGVTKENWPIYKMPDGSGGWMLTSPELHARYIKQEDERAGGKLRRTAQLMKFWRECRSPKIPLSSFHIEMLLASSGICTGVKSYAECVTEMLQLLAQRQCHALQDPLGITGNIGATRSLSQREGTLSSIVYSREHAKAALIAEARGVTQEAGRQWDIVFNGHFPRRIVI